MKIVVNNIEREWIISAIEHYVEDCKAELTETESPQFKSILELAIDGRSSLLAKLKRSRPSV